ncbi:hypothetical protein BGC07_15525 [Piscirickettsia litoralis]|uniref:Uncharacterized protein n=2 Tax=Piscirickettsia litoralis TaxID=1891921 RepID=A0ABX2ZY44_9GAMM|nr:hypothetical protein BGC07_15525 [Piscirickettsia litoralis]
MLQHYLDKTVNEMMTLLPGRNKDQIYSKAKRMGLTSVRKDFLEPASNDKNMVEVDLSSTEGVVKLIRYFNAMGLRFVVEPGAQIQSI